MQKISENIEYISADGNPLSCDVGIIHGGKCDWIFDVGNNENSAQIINSVSKPKNIILSHFHIDHSDNLKKIKYDNLYCGSFSRKKFSDGIEINRDLNIKDEINFTIFPVPCCHTKDSVELLIDEKYAFLGDCIYPMHKDETEKQFITQDSFTKQL